MVGVAAGGAGADVQTYLPRQGVESTYFEPGPWAVTEEIGFGCCDAAGAKYDIWYPTALGRGGMRHPIVVWGDGTNATPTQYTYLLRHFASWGFVVIATENKQTGSGQEILGSLDYLKGVAAEPSSVFHDRLDTAAVGAVGHSQGATGVLNAMSNSNGAIKTAVPIELPAQFLCSIGINCADSRRIGAGSVFFVNGTADAFISPSTQPLPWQSVGLQSNQAYYEATSAQIPKVWAALNGPDHNDIQGQPDCATASDPCARGVFGYLGYPTAWLMDQLRGDARAHEAFIAGTGELFAAGNNWTHQSSNIAG